MWARCRSSSRRPRPAPGLRATPRNGGRPSKTPASSRNDRRPRAAGRHAGPQSPKLADYRKFHIEGGDDPMPAKASVKPKARLRHIALCVKDIDETADFYEKAF